MLFHIIFFTVFEWCFRGVDGGANQLPSGVSLEYCVNAVVGGCWSRRMRGWRSRNINQLTFKRPVFTLVNVFTDLLSLFFFRYRVWLSLIYRVGSMRQPNEMQFSFLFHRSWVNARRTRRTKQKKLVRV